MGLVRFCGWKERDQGRGGRRGVFVIMVIREWREGGVVTWAVVVSGVDKRGNFDAKIDKVVV